MKEFFIIENWLPLIFNIRNSKMPSLGLISGRKEVQDNLNLAYDPVRIEKIKKEILACQSVTIS